MEDFRNLFLKMYKGRKMPCHIPPWNKYIDIDISQKKYSSIFTRIFSTGYLCGED